MMGLGAICAAGAFVAPALQAQEGRGIERSYAKRLAPPVRSGLGTFTPAAADPKLAAILALFQKQPAPVACVDAGEAVGEAAARPA